jgi:hypothetical protein
VWEGDESWEWLFVADEFAQQARRRTEISMPAVHQGMGKL